ncbi:MAG: MFS transporter [Chloroflexi bacterium]|nr:MFS transporter [Chloroflexota bacterium]
MQEEKRQRRKPLVFYGWLIVAMAGIRGSFGVGTYFASSVLFLPMQEELGWSRTTFFGIITMRQLGAGILAPLVGAWGDHPWLPRLILPVSTLFLGASFISAKWVQTPAQLYLIHGILGTIGVALAGNAIIDAIVAKWFIRKRAKALMWANVGPGSGALVFPVVITAMLAVFGWRDTWFWLGVGTILILFPLSLIARTRPEEMGLLPDGVDALDVAAGRGPTPASEVSLTRHEALRTMAFWLLVGSLALGMLGVQGYQVHWIPYLREQDFSPAASATAVFLYGVFTVVARFVWGYLSGRYQARFVLSIQAVTAGAGIVLFMFVPNTPMLMVWGVYQGLTLAAFFQLHALIAANYFGRAHVGAIRGAMFPIAVSFNSVSPLLLGYMRDAFGSYTLAFGLLVVTWGISAALVFMAKPPHKASQPASV